MSFENGNFLWALATQLGNGTNNMVYFWACQEKKGYGLDAVIETKSSQFYQDLQIWNDIFKISHLASLVTLSSTKNSSCTNAK